MFERSATMSSRPSVISAMVRRALMMLVAALMIAIGSIVGLSPGVEASSMTAVEMRTSRVARDAALAVFAERQRVRDEPGYAKVIEFPHFAAAQAGRATSLPGRTTRRRDSVMAARDVAALDAGTSTYGYDFASRRTTDSQFVATKPGAAAGEGADSHGGGRNDQHGDGGRRGDSNAGQVQELKDKLDELVKNQGSRSEKDKIRTKIKNLEEEARQAAKGENHSRRPKR